VKKEEKYAKLNHKALKMRLGNVIQPNEGPRSQEVL